MRSPRSPQVTLRTFPRGARGPLVRRGSPQAGVRSVRLGLSAAATLERWVRAASQSSLGLGGRSPTLGKRGDRRGASLENFLPLSKLCSRSRERARDRRRAQAASLTKGQPRRVSGGRAVGRFKDAIVSRICFDHSPPPPRG